MESSSDDVKYNAMIAHAWHVYNEAVWQLDQLHNGAVTYTRFVHNSTGTPLGEIAEPYAISDSYYAAKLAEHETARDAAMQRAYETFRTPSPAPTSEYYEACTGA
jgi:hypothetical protein